MSGIFPQKRRDLLILAALAGMSAAAAAQPVVECAADPGERKTCAADTSAGIALLRRTGPEACLLGYNWGYDETGVWVADGCGGEFALGVTEAASTTDPASPPPSNSNPESYETWGFYDPGKGFLVGESDAGSLSLSAYALVRYMDQGGNDSFIDHNGTEQVVDLRRDIYSHRVLVFLAGWIGDPKLVYNLSLIHI